MNGNLVYDEWSHAAQQLGSLLQPQHIFSGASELDLQSLFFQYPLFLGLATGAGEPVFIRKGTKLSVRYPDFLIFFYGAASFDIFEVKRPSNTVITHKGTLTKKTEKGIEQLLLYDRIFQKGRSSIIGGGKTEGLLPPRLILVAGGYVAPGDSLSGKCTPKDDFERIAEAMGKSKYQDLFRSKRLIVTTSATLIEATQVAKKKQALLSSSEANRQIGRRWARQRVSLAASFVITEPGATWQKVGRSVQDKPFGLIEEGTPVSRIAEEYSDQLLQTISHILPGPPDSTNLLNATMLLSEICLYEQDGDLPIGRWEHTATYRALDLLKGLPSQHQEHLVHQLSRIMAVDRSEDVIGAMSHMGRKFPALTEYMRSERAWGNRLRAIYEARSSRRPLTIMDAHIAYLLALHGDNSAADLLNQFAQNKAMMADVASWNLLHAYRKPKGLLESMHQKANSDDDNLRRFKSWHQAVYSGYSTMLEAEHLAGFVR